MIVMWHLKTFWFFKKNCIFCSYSWYLKIFSYILLGWVVIDVPIVCLYSIFKHFLLMALFGKISVSTNMCCMCVFPKIYDK